MTNLDKFQALLDTNGIRHFNAKELFFRGAGDASLKLNIDPDEALWPRIIPTVKVLDALRAELKAPITLLSIYRGPAYNRAIGGEKNSYHMQFRAIDFRCAVGTPKTWAALLRSYRAKGMFAGGIGTYPTFVHVDTRGYNANW